MIQRRGTAGVIGEQVFQFGLKLWIAPCFLIGLLQLFERRHQNFGDIAAAVWTEVAAGVRGG